MEDISIEDIVKQSNPVARKKIEEMWRNKRDFVRLYVVQSHTNSEEGYLVGQRRDGSWECSCPHFIFRASKTGEICKHIQDILKNPQLYTPVFDKRQEDYGEVISLFSNPSVELEDNEGIGIIPRESIFANKEEDIIVLGDTLPSEKTFIELRPKEEGFLKEEEEFEL